MYMQNHSWPCKSWTQEDLPYPHSLLCNPTLVVCSAYQNGGFITAPVALVGHGYLSTESGPLSECEVVLE